MPACFFGLVLRDPRQVEGRERCFRPQKVWPYLAAVMVSTPTAAGRFKDVFLIRLNVVLRQTATCHSILVPSLSMLYQSFLELKVKGRKLEKYYSDDEMKWGQSIFTIEMIWAS